MPQRSLLTYFSAPSIDSSTQPSTAVNPSSPGVENSPISGFPRADAEAADAQLPDKDAHSTPALYQQPAGHSAEGYPLRQEQASLAAVSHRDLPAARRLTCALLPVRYPDSFFTGAIDDPIVSQLSRVVRINDVVIGWIRCRLDAEQRRVSQNTTTEDYSVYIQALCIQPAHQGQGHGSALLKDVCQSANRSDYAAKKITAHVWEHNVDAITWYARRGFKRIVLIDSYYRKLRPAGAWIMQKDLE